MQAAGHHHAHEHNHNHHVGSSSSSDDEDDGSSISGEAHHCSHHMATDAVLDITLGEPGARTLLRHFSQVKSLYIRYTALEDDDAEHPLGRGDYTVTTESIVGMFQILAGHASLRQIIVHNLEDMEGDARCQCHFPLRALTEFLEKAQHILVIQLDLDTAIAGTEEEGQAFLRVLRQHPSLKILDIGDFGNANSSIPADRFSPLCIPKWEVLTIAHTENQITEQQVEQNLKSSALKKLLIDTSNGQFQRHLPKIFETLRTNACNIMELNLLDEFTEESAAQCAEMVRQNTTLENLFVSLGIESKYGTRVTEALLHNSNIQSLRLVMSGERNGDAKALIGHLKDNRVLKKVHLHFQGIFDHNRVKQVFMEPFADILECNCHIEEILMDKCHGLRFDNTPEIEFYLSLNKAGRKHLMNGNADDPSATRSLWIDTIIQNRSDVSIVFYFLSRSPTCLPIQ